MADPISCKEFSELIRDKKVKKGTLLRLRSNGNVVKVTKVNDGIKDKTYYPRIEVDLGQDKKVWLAPWYFQEIVVKK